MKSIHPFITSTCVIALASSASVFAHDEEQPGTAPATAKVEVKATTPLEACNTLVEATKKNDQQTVKKMTADWGQVRQMAPHAKGKNFKQQFEAMRQKQMQKLSNLTCKSEEVAEDKAMVVSESDGKKRLIPFVQEDGMWKFDSRSYMAIYRENLRAHGFKIPGPEGETKTG